MYFGYCLIPFDNCWTPPVHLETAEAAFCYCKLHHRWFQEIRITDEDDFMVLHVIDHMLMYLRADGTMNRTLLG